MPIYVIAHTIYSYEDHDYETSVELFESYKDASLYFDMLKANIITEYENHTGEKLKTLEQWDEFYMHDSTYDLPNNPNKRILSIELEEYGSDFITIKEKYIMSFKEA